jgi:tripartite-type tricarboxylate transporter receptor subunit TctC
MRVLWFALCLLALHSAGAAGPPWPARPIRIVSAQAGGGTDFAARLIAQGLAQSLRQAVVVDNRPAIVQGRIVSKAAPDGYTLAVLGESLWVQALLQPVPYDPQRDFTPIVLALSSPNVLVVHPSLAVASVKELIALANARPNELNYGSSGVGASAHLAAELFKGMTGVKIVHVPFKGTAEMTTSLMSGQLQLAFLTITAALPQAKSGKLKALAVTSAKPTVLMPDLPTVAETVPGYVTGGEVAVLGPAGLPRAIVDRVHADVVQILNAPASRERLLNAGFEVVAGSPEDLRAWIKSESVRWSRVIKDAGIRVN